MRRGIVRESGWEKCGSGNNVRIVAGDSNDWARSRRARYFRSFARAATRRSARRSDTWSACARSLARSFARARTPPRHAICVPCGDVCVRERSAGHARMQRGRNTRVYVGETILPAAAATAAAAADGAGT